MNNTKPLNQLIDELKPEEYADFVSCMKENFGTANCQNPKHYKMLKDILCKPENKAYFDTLTKGCQAAMMIYIEAYERQMFRFQDINDALRSLD